MHRTVHALDTALPDILPSTCAQMTCEGSYHLPNALGVWEYHETGRSVSWKELG